MSTSRPSTRPPRPPLLRRWLAVAAAPTARRAPALWLVLLGAAALLAAGCGPAPRPPDPLTPVTLQLRWSHNAQFAGFYAADQNGYYAEEGLAVSFVEGGPQVDLIAPLLDGSAQFSVGLADALLLARADGKAVQAFATIYQRSPLVFIALADSGITRPQDFVGKAIRSAPAASPTLHAMMQRLGIDASSYREVELPSDVDLFVTGEVPVWSAFINNLVLDLRLAGHDITVFYPDEYGVHFYGDTLLTSEALIAGDPELVARFLRATLRGWRFAVEHPDAAGPLVQQYVPGADPARESEAMIITLPMVNTGEEEIGWMRPAVWAGMERTLREQGVLPRQVDPAGAYTLQFLQDIYGSP